MFAGAGMLNCDFNGLSGKNFFLVMRSSDILQKDCNLYTGRSDLILQYLYTIE